MTNQAPIYIIKDTKVAIQLIAQLIKPESFYKNDYNQLTFKNT